MNYDEYQDIKFEDDIGLKSHADIKAEVDQLYYSYRQFRWRRINANWTDISPELLEQLTSILDDFGLHLGEVESELEVADPSPFYVLYIATRRATTNELAKLLSSLNPHRE